MDVLVGIKSGNLTGVVDWIDVIVELIELPFGAWIACLVLMDPVNDSGLRIKSVIMPTFRQTLPRYFHNGIQNRISNRTRQTLDKAKALEMLVRYGFDWEEGFEQEARYRTSRFILRL